MTLTSESSEALWTYGLPVGGVLLVLVTGLITLWRQVTGRVEKLTFALEFRERFIAYCNSSGEDNAAYTWLTLNCTRMQNEMGPMGIYSAFRPPHAQFMLQNYPIIMNMLPELKRWFSEHRQGFGAFGSMVDSYASAIDEALLRYIGVTQQTEQEARQRLKNPLLWLRTGVEQVLSLPLFIFVWFGLAGISAVRRLQANVLFKIISVVTTVVGLISGVMGMVLGWHDMAELIRKCCL